ncbi:MAG: FKBP-type peptidyl-prolyl cis-trans isomerase [Methanocorpusculum sp.]|nr:FKBP-type peptidyl-prolyl cis-trans isomerase [Methanocorpusculum sp.]
MKKSITAAVVLLAAVCLIFTAGCTAEQTAKTGDTVSVYYTLTLSDGTVHDSNLNRSAMEFVIGGGTTIKGFSNAVIGMKVGETKTVVIPPEDAYGEISYDTTTEQNLTNIENYLGRKAVAGDTFDMIHNNNGAYTAVTGEILSINETAKTAVVAVYPRLAGETLTFKITLNSITPAK